MVIRRGRIQMVFAKKEKKKEYRVRSEENKFFYTAFAVVLIILKKISNKVFLN